MMYLILAIALIAAAASIVFLMGYMLGRPSRPSQLDKFYYWQLRYWLRRMKTMYAVDCQLNPNCSHEFKVAYEHIRNLLKRLGEEA